MLPIALPLRAGVRPILRLFSDLSLFKIEHPHDEPANRGGAAPSAPFGGHGPAARRAVVVSPPGSHLNARTSTAPRPAQHTGPSTPALGRLSLPRNPVGRSRAAVLPLRTVGCLFGSEAANK